MLGSTRHFLALVQCLRVASGRPIFRGLTWAVILPRIGACALGVWAHTQDLPLGVQGSGAMVGWMNAVLVATEGTAPFFRTRTRQWLSPSWAAGVARNREDERDGSNGGGWEYSKRQPGSGNSRLKVRSSVISLYPERFGTKRDRLCRPTWLPSAGMVPRQGPFASVLRVSRTRGGAESIFFYMAVTGVALIPVALQWTDFSRPVHALRYGKAGIVGPSTAMAIVSVLILHWSNTKEIGLNRSGGYV
jgi:hypothetical protein